MKEKDELKIVRKDDEKQEVDVDASALLTPTELPKKVIRPKYFCTIRQFAYFVGGTDSQQRTIIKNAKSEEEVDHPFWYQTAQSSIGKSLKNGEHTPIYEGISKLKKTNPTGKQSKPNKELSILVLEKYLKITLPLNFRQLKKTSIALEAKTYNCFGVEIKITPDFVFRAEHQGKKIVGAVRVNLKKTPPMSPLRMNIVSYILNKFLEKHVAKEGEVVMPEFCLCIDVYGGNCVHAPSGTDIPHIVLKQATAEYAKKWDKS